MAQIVECAGRRTTRKCVKDAAGAHARAQDPSSRVTRSRWRKKLEQGNQTLENYLNIVSYGNGAYGFEAAAQYYFKKKGRGA